MEPNTTGHDVHFLQRLERVSLPQVELAMSLYNDSALVRFILHRAALPESAASVAISLDDPDMGPFVIVTRTGRFVTCLGKDMRLEPGTPVLTRQHLDTLIDKADDLRARVEQARRVAGNKGRVYQLLRRIFTAGDDLSREEFVGISAWRPLLGREFLVHLMDAVIYLDKVRGLLRNLDKPRRQDESLLHHYWNMFWASGHLALLIGAEAREILDSLPVAWEKMSQGGLTLSWGLVRQGFVPLAVRGAWLAGKLGRRGFTMYKDNYLRTDSTLQLADSGLGLVALAIRHSSLRGEIRKLLPREIPDDGTYPTRFKSLITTAANAAVELATVVPEVYNEKVQNLGRKTYLRLLGETTEEDPSDSELAGIPEEVVIASLTCVPSCFLKDGDRCIDMFMLTPFLARAEPEAFYFKQADIDRLKRPWVPEDSLRLLRLYRDRYVGVARPACAAAQPGRNDPCPCGSGKKYKRCCRDGSAKLPTRQSP